MLWGVLVGDGEDASFQSHQFSAKINVKYKINNQDDIVLSFKI